MARTVLVTNEAPVPYLGSGACGFCTTVTMTGVEHRFCPGEVPNAAGAPGSVWTCACHAAGHETGA